MTSSFVQPAPTKAYAVFYNGAWYGQGDTIKLAWGDVHRQLSPHHDRYGAALYAKIRRFGRAQETAVGHEQRCVANYVSEGLGEF